MPQDYAKRKAKPKSRKGASRKKQKPFPIFAVLIVGMVLGGFIGFLVYLKWLPSQAPEQIATKTQSKPEKKVTKKPQPKPEKKETKPQYTYHKELMGKEVKIPEEELSAPNSDIKREYVMPCGSFRNEQMAESLKARIAFLNFEAQVLPVDNKNGRWYRVQLGPFNSKRKAESIRHRLQANEMNDCRIHGRVLTSN
ncbi:SPOR domain-containing protein [Pleionea sp. CnH1-48]|uniref:SPOR domain-containing protein n=1 Tax=Pleionea sp. CnH1-48 TaxID=2954494 RepID=UPI002096CDB8|nr:SPOR domain-containing protein [Pleionea sp. CnH1-48]MCO7224486.1 SPOR domain-containing protein [Pleionea sp. CnH1-48]